MSILFFIHTFVLASIDNTAISIVDFLMVEDCRYQHFPWGQLSFSKLIGSLRQDFDVSKKLYRLYGMPYALNVWIYECASNLNSEIAVRERNVIPRICNWRVVSEKAKFEMLMSTIFQKVKFYFCIWNIVIYVFVIHYELLLYLTVKLSYVFVIHLECMFKHCPNSRGN